MNLKKITLLFFCLAIGGGLIFNFRFKSKFGLDFADRDKFKLVDTYEDTQVVFRGLYKLTDSYLRLEIVKNLDNQAASNLENQKLAGFQGLFENNIAPYPGEVSKVTECSEEFKPQKNDVGGKKFFTGYLNSRLQFGSCNKDQLLYKGVIGYLYCPEEKNFYQIEYFVDKNLPDSTAKLNGFLSTINCR